MNNDIYEKYSPKVTDLMAKEECYIECYIIMPEKKIKKAKQFRDRGTRRKNSIKKAKKRRKIICESNCHPCSCFHGSIDLDRDETDGKISYTGNYIKYSSSSERQRFLKTRSHRKVRRIPVDEEEVGHKGNLSNRVFDYHWELD